MTRAMREPGAGAHGFWTGVAGGAAATLVLLAGRLATGVPAPQEALAERMVRLLPDEVFTLLLAELQHLAKPLGFLAAVAAGLVGFGAGGALYARATRRSRLPRPVLGLASGAITWAFLTYAFLPFIEGGALGAPLTTVVPAPALPLAAASLVYGFLLAGLSRQAGSRGAGPARGPAPRADRAPVLAGATSRRSLLRRSALALCVAAVSSRLGAWADATGARVAGATSGASRLLKGMPPEVTPNVRFYQVSKNYPFDPAVDVATWSLEVTGVVARPLRLSYAELVRAAPPVERYHTLECVSNEVGGDLIGNARWKGARVRDVLALAGVGPEAATIVWRSADGYVESVPLAVAMDPESLLAYEMNGEPLPRTHGAPLRVLLPDRYGMKQPKWLTRIEAGGSDIPGYWERQRLSRRGIVKTGSAFLAEAAGGGLVRAGGWAFAGRRGISRVELSADGGRTWFPAAVRAPLGVNCWQFWSAEWTPPAPGEYALLVRAADGAGAVQPGRRRRLPDGAEGYHEVRIRIPG